MDGELKAKSHEENRYKTRSVDITIVCLCYGNNLVSLYLNVYFVCCRYVFLFDKVMLMCKVRVGFILLFLKYSFVLSCAVIDIICSVVLDWLIPMCSVVFSVT